MELKVYRGHIRNWEELSAELGIDTGLSRKEREKNILLKGYERWGCELPDKLYGMFAFVIYDEKKMNYTVREIILEQSRFTITLRRMENCCMAHL